MTPSWADRGMVGSFDRGAAHLFDWFCALQLLLQRFDAEWPVRYIAPPVPPGPGFATGTDLPSRVAGPPPVRPAEPAAGRTVDAWRGIRANVGLDVGEPVPRSTGGVSTLSRVALGQPRTGTRRLVRGTDLVRSNAENGVVSDGVAPVPAAVIDELVAWFAQHERPACWLCADGPSRVETARRLEGAGCRADLEAREMHAALRHLDLRDQSPPDGVEIRLVSNGSDMDGWLDIAGHCDWYDGRAQRDVWRALYVSVGFAGRRRSIFTSLRG